MKSAILDYLTSERILGLAAGLVGAASVLLALYLLLGQRGSFRAFAWTMLVLGVLECGFLVSYFRTPEPARSAQMVAFETDAAKVTSEQTQRIESHLNAVFWVKLFYALLILGGVVALSKLPVGVTGQGVLIALILHASCAITIDNFVERQGKISLRALSAS